ncbi:MAG: Rieske (2Fe-2S) protein [Chloroflexi bacterium]|nr:Rieske (2Fe-2S) protein [Chloroflexota bacterium]
MVATLPLASRAYNLGQITRIPPGEGRTFQIGHDAVAVFQTRGGEVFATQAWCPHEAAPLAEGMIGAGKLVCPIHACRFDLATGQPERNGGRPLKTYPVCLDEMGDILLYLDDRRFSGLAAG